VPEEKIVFIHHGIPDTPFIDPSFNKDKFGVEGKKVLLTFGLLSPNKGIENVLLALPAVINKHPDVAYIILGATHPHILKSAWGCLPYHAAAARAQTRYRRACHFSKSFC
jgi:glycosyltransferase involved in cell wall biosynthesis